MGYQLAKDPMTGQILLIPTDPSAPGGPGSVAPPPMWPGYDPQGPPPTSSCQVNTRLLFVNNVDHVT